MKIGNVSKYYRYLSGQESVFKAVSDQINSQIKTKYGDRWAREYKKLTRKINRKISWLKENEEDPNTKYFFTEKGARKYEKTLFKIHKEVLKSKINKKEFRFSKKMAGNKVFIYNSKTKKIVGELVYGNKYQIGVKVK